ncbi:MAG: flagellar biosynthetic protein FliR [Spongiibacteraceae bacterium]|nr:flagellar biosynthetic protein FliR [Spongiibacteraceae bacterium]
MTALIGKLWWPFLRYGALLWTMPLIGDLLPTPQVRVLLALLLAIITAPLLPPLPAVEPLSIAAALIALEQILLGVLLGLALQILFTALTMLGQILSLQMGLAMAVMNDPVNGQSVPLLGQLMMILGGLLFLAIDGHLIAIDVMVESFFAWQPGAGAFALSLERVVALFGWLFGAALVLAMPAVIAMLLVNLTFGVMNRSAPALNIFSLGFPIGLLMGMVFLLFSISGVPGRFVEFTGYVLDQMRALLY